MMKGAGYTARIKPAAEKEMDRLPATVFDRVADVILQLESEPRPHGSQKLRGTEAYRVRVGSYRILYTVDDGLRIVEIYSVGHRRDVYR